MNNEDHDLFKATRQDALVLFLIVGLVIATAIMLPMGFTGTDDYRYLLAAERWITEGVHTGENHWANRLPYVLMLVASFSLFGITTASMIVVNSTLFIVCCFAAWKIGQHAFEDETAGLLGVLVILFTPLLMRQPTYFYPEVSEVAFLTTTVLLVLTRLRWSARKRLYILLIAGFCGGLAMLVRQTAVAVPAALALVMLLLTPSEPLVKRIRDIAVLAGGFAIPIAAECVFYLLMTGNPLHRFEIDSSHVKIASRLKGKETIDTDNVLFNWELASRWERDALFPTHWTITPFARLYFSAGLLLLPWIALVGSYFAWKRGGGARNLVYLTALIILLQYILNTFVIVLPPNTRYFGVGLILLGMLAGYALHRIKSLSWRLMTLIALFAAPALLVLALQPRFAVMNDQLVQLIKKVGEPVYLPGPMPKYTALLRRENPEVRSLMRIGKPPVGGLMAIMGPAVPSMGAGKCRDGEPTRVVMTSAPRSLIYEGIKILGIPPVAPKKVVELISHEKMRVTIYRRVC